MNDIANLTEELSRLGTQPATAADLVRVLQTVAQVSELIDHGELDHADLSERIAQLENKLLVVDALPQDAKLGAFIRRTDGDASENATVYVGNGLGEVLTKLVPSAL